MMTPQLQEAINALRHVSKTVAQTQPIWSAQLELVCSSCEKLDLLLDDVYLDLM